MFSSKYDLILYENSVSQNLKIPLRVPEKTDIVVTGKTDVGTVTCTASFGGYLIEE